MINSTRVAKIEPGFLTLLGEDGESKIPADTVILASGATGDLTLADQCRELGYDTHVAGDCDGVSYIEGAIRSAHEVARAL